MKSRTQTTIKIVKLMLGGFNYYYYFFFKQYVSTIRFLLFWIVYKFVDICFWYIYSIRNYRRLENEFKLGKWRVCWECMISVIHLSYFWKFDNTTLTDMKIRFRQNNKTLVIRPHNDPLPVKRLFLCSTIIFFCVYQKYSLFKDT